MRDRDETPIWPHNPAPFLTDWLFEIGPTKAGAMGEVSISWSDLTSWQSITGIELEPWEGRLLCRLSGVFAEERYLARKRDRQIPWSGIEALPKLVQDKVQSQFAALAAAFGPKKAPKPSNPKR